MIEIYRLARWLHVHRVPLLPKLLYLLNRMLFATVVPPSAELGQDVILGYRGLAIVTNRQARVGHRVNIDPKVINGGRAGLRGAPVIEDDVMIGSGAQVLGPIRIGRGAQIGANAVVLADVPAYAVAVGVPARVVRQGAPSVVGVGGD